MPAPVKPIPAITIADVTKRYAVYSEPRDLLLETLTGKIRHTTVDALKGIDLEVARGEVLGIIGRNGSGKSTLLKIISDKLAPSGGTVTVRGRLSAILELGTGFQDDLSGRENIRIGSLYLGMTPKEIDTKRDWIIEFSGLEEAIDQPFKTYSTGMKGRLTFATAVAVDPDILIIDEALATGDAFFVHKCLGRIKEICASGSTVLLVTHGTHLVSQLCDRALWLEDGATKMLGDSLEVVRAYDYHIHLAVAGAEGQLVDIDSDTLNAAGIAADPAGQMVADLASDAETVPVAEASSMAPPLAADIADDGEVLTETVPAPQAAAVANDDPSDEPDMSTEKQKVFRRGPMVINRVQFLDGDGGESRIFQTARSMRIRVHYSCEGDLPDETLGLAIGIQRESDLELINQFSTCNVRSDEDLRTYDEAPFRIRPGRKGTIEALIDPIQMSHGTYIVSVGIIPNRPNETAFYEYHHMTYKIEVQRDGWPFTAVYYPLVTWAHDPK